MLLDAPPVELLDPAPDVLLDEPELDDEPAPDDDDEEDDGLVLDDEPVVVVGDGLEDEPDAVVDDESAEPTVELEQAPMVSAAASTALARVSATLITDLQGGVPDAGTRPCRP